MPPCQLWTSHIPPISHLFCYSPCHSLFISYVSATLGASQGPSQKLSLWFPWNFACNSLTSFRCSTQQTVWRWKGHAISSSVVTFAELSQLDWSCLAVRWRPQWDPDHLMSTCQLLLCLGCCLWSSRCESVFWIYGSNYYMFLATLLLGASYSTGLFTCHAGLPGCSMEPGTWQELIRCLEHEGQA